MFNLKSRLEVGTISKEELLRGCQRAIRLYDTMIAELQAKPVPDQAVNYVISTQKQQVIEFMVKLERQLSGKHQHDDAKDNKKNDRRKK
jgi:hypothetical protein